MAFTTWTLTGDIAELVGTDYSPGKVALYLTPSNQVITDGVTLVRVGDYQATIAPDGTFTIAGIPDSTAHATSYKATLKWQTADGGRTGEQTSGWFNVTANANFAAKWAGAVQLVTVDATIAANVAAAAATINARSIKGSVGRSYTALLGTIRNAGSGGGYWQPINDASHRPAFIDSVSTDTTAITINHTTLAAGKVGSLIVVPDETLMAAGITAGVSVGLTSSVITLRRRGPVMSDYVSYSGSAWSSNSGVFTGITYVGGVLHLAHPVLPVPDAFGVSISPRGGAHQITVNGVSTNYVDIEFRNWSGTLITTAASTMQAYVTRGGHEAALNPQAVDTTAYPGSNLWVLGVFEDA